MAKIDSVSLTSIPLKEGRPDKLTKKEKEVFIRDLTTFAEKFLYESYGMKLTIPIVINSRLKTALAYFRFWHNGIPENISVSEKFLAGSRYDSLEVAFGAITAVLKHELVHYALFMKKEPFNDGDPHFESELARVSACSSAVTKDSKKSTDTALINYSFYTKYELADKDGAIIDEGTHIFMAKDLKKIMYRNGKVKSTKEIEVRRIMLK